jgi:hypothetical protein
MKNSVSLYLRVRSANGSCTYVKSTCTPNHRLKALHGIVDGVSTRCPEGSYHLRFDARGKT